MHVRTGHSCVPERRGQHSRTARAVAKAATGVVGGASPCAEDTDGAGSFPLAPCMHAMSRRIYRSSAMRATEAMGKVPSWLSSCNTNLLLASYFYCEPLSEMAIFEEQQLSKPSKTPQADWCV